MKFFYPFLALVLILVVVSGCAEKTKVVKLPPITGQATAVIQEPEVQEAEEENTTEESESFEEVTPPEETEEIADIHALEAGEWQETAQQILSVMDLNIVDCDEIATTLGFKSCYKDESNESLILTIKNSGRGTIDELLYVIEDPAGKMNFELAEGMLTGESKIYVINLKDWEQEYGAIARILITPRLINATDTIDCVNRQLLLIPAENCHKVLE